MILLGTNSDVRRQGIPLRRSSAYRIFAAMRMILCTGNPGKAAELRALLPASIEVITLSDAGLPADLPEDADTLEGNALQKARYAFARTGLPCLADDTGLEVAAIGGAPGVFSARYAGPAKDAGANTRKLLMEMDGVQDRRARFRTVLAWVAPDEERLFEGVIDGRITAEPLGNQGFGYDPVFIPDGVQRTFAQMGEAEKNAISHRALAMREAAAFLSARSGTR
jgi:XTP/dITP diphosphohydrolase